MPIKVLVISDYRPYHTVRPEAEIFIGLAKLGFRVTVMTYGEARYAEEFRKAGITVIDFHPQKKFDAAEIGRIRAELVAGKYDIIHLFNSPSTVSGIRAARGLPVKVVLYRGYAGHIHWYDPTAYLKYLHPRVDKIVCNSVGVEEIFRRQLFFDKSKAVTINKGHRVEWYDHTVPADVRTQFNLPANAFVVVNVANNRPMKGIPYLLKAMSYLPPELPVHLLLIGNDMDDKANLALINGSPNRDKIHILGFQKEALNIVAAADVFALSSVKGESITKSVIEAMSMGVTPVITDIAGNRELVEGGVSGLVVPSRNAQALGKALLSLYRDRPRCKKMGVNARKHIQTHLNTEDTVLKYKNLYEELAGRKG
jgi:glycosyltransferase involved in cell wall biosynthesis